MINAMNIDSVKDIDSIMSEITINTPSEVPLSAEIIASDVLNQLALQYGPDSSNVRSMLTLRKLGDMARAHLRRSFDPDVTAEDDQLVFTEFGSDIQRRYPIKATSSEGKLKTEYQSPMYAPVDQLLAIADGEIRVGNTRVRRGNALIAFVAEYRT